MQALSLQAEPQVQLRDARKPASIEVLVHSDAPSDKHEEKFLRSRTSTSARAQELQSYMGTAS